MEVEEVATEVEEEEVWGDRSRKRGWLDPSDVMRCRVEVALLLLLFELLLSS